LIGRGNPGAPGCRTEQKSVQFQGFRLVPADAKTADIWSYPANSQ
jgi:hypothetical protein